MAFFEEFKNSLLPGNYALTKSMELTKTQTSGTLWYTKKYLTLYYYVFLSNEIFTNEYITQVRNIFDNYINSLDEATREYATAFFYPENESIDFRSDNFNTFSAFTSDNNFNNQNERNKYYQNAKKCYFALLMGTGGQSKVKELVIASIKDPSFKYSANGMKELILNSVATVCVEKATNNEDFFKSDVARIISQHASNEIKRVAANSKINFSMARSIIDLYPCSLEYPGLYSRYEITSPQFSGVESDCFASVRNERQILYYYGYFHSKSSGATDFEFSSLTPVGELALRANSKEFLAIWEHQKIKMISQPAIADVNDISLVTNNADKFAISYNPYTDILGHLVRNSTLSLDEYKYIVSRKKSTLDEIEWQENETETLENIDDIRNVISAFGRNSDVRDEDGRKELLKYILGIREDLNFDNHTNILSVLNFRNSKINVNNKDLLILLYSVYSKLDNYKIEKYASIFLESSADLKRRYVKNTIGEKNVSINPRVKIHWDLYNIHPDKLIMLSSIITISIAALGFTTIENLDRHQINDLQTYMSANFKGLLRGIGVNSVAKIRRETQAAINAIKNEDFSGYISMNNDDRNIENIDRYREINAEDLRTRIEQVSAEAKINPAEDRTRNANLVSMLKSYYIQRFAQKDMLSCECCGEETFITQAGEPYVEFHHLIPFNIAYGPDHYLNLFALCPNCHKKFHFISIDEKALYYNNLNTHNYMNLALTRRLRLLREQNLLRSYHLEYLFADNAITLEEYNSIAA